ncbi:HEPN domain-containing protein [Patescibacteria group bacterium]|nr:HEPN domain-containing protein [Patescibacteria group bacterium]MCG2693616.1 HEPN domain-containing protein [Candidatus Parcubacteria bacterium]
METAQYTLKEDKDWAYSIAYNSMLQICRAYMMTRGVRPTTGEGGHKVVFEYLKIILPKQYFFTLDLLDNIRQKRNRAVYDVPDIISEREAHDVLELAKEFVPEMIKLIKLRLNKE